MGVSSLVIGVILSLFLWIREATSDSLHPIRFPNEEEYFRAKTHERSMTLEEMNSKIQTMRSRRKFQPWNPSHPQVHKLLSKFNSSSINGRSRRPNILFMLADDLGYGDLSVEPFTTDPESTFPCGQGDYLSYNLEKMASKGIVMTNFHSAAPVCSPARAAIMSGLYSWRMTAMNAFELGRDLSQRNGFLPQIPTIPEVFREYGYFTAHSGKWHLGGMREEMRKDRVYNDQCNRPSPNQHGFEEYISELDGPESPRYTFLLQSLHTLGHHHLLKDDVPVPIIEQPNVQNVLSDREAGDAVDFIRNQHKNHPNQPWFVQVWFNAPHHPWQLINSGEALYGKKYNKTQEDYAKHMCRWENRDYPLQDQQYWRYKTMIAAMDTSIGNLLNVVEELGLEEDTLIVFTSDNGNEDGSGSGGLYKEGKRSLMEGGVRSPTIMQWKGVIPAGSYSSYFGGHTDFFPTFLEAADIPRPPHVHFDGVSLLPVLRRAPLAPTKRIELRHKQYHVPVNVPGEDVIRQRLLHRYQKDVFLQHQINLTYGFQLQNDDNSGLEAWHRLPEASFSALSATETTYDVADKGGDTSGTSNKIRKANAHHGKTTTNTTSHAQTADSAVNNRHRRLYLVPAKPKPVVDNNGVVNTGGRMIMQTTATASKHHTISPHTITNHHQTSSKAHQGSPPPPAPHVDNQHVTGATDPSADNNQQNNNNNHHGLLDGEYVEYLVSNRVYLWHKETDPPKRSDERMGSAGYFDHVKVIAQGRRGCIDRIFDMKNDPFENHNLLSAPYSQHEHCKLSLYDVDGNAIRHALQSNQGLTLPEHCQHHNKDSCKEKYLSMVIFKVMIVVRKLLPFIRDGNHGHQLYMSEDSDKAVCDVPMSSKVKQMEFFRGTDCEKQRFGCSFPEYY